MSNTLCPYCGRDFGKVLKRGRNCPACNGAVKMRRPHPYTTLDAHIPQIAMTAAQAEVEEQKWRLLGMNQQVIDITNEVTIVRDEAPRLK